jgi:hypothetical protein
MKLIEPNNPNERKKMIAAAVLGVVAIIVLSYAFFGGGSKTPPANRNVAVRPSPGELGVRANRPTPEPTPDEPAILQPIPVSWSVTAVPEANRNIFAYYEPPPPPVVIPPTPTPTPPPPLTVSSLSPSNVYARTADFSLQVMGDKFTSAVHITIDGRDLPTRFINAQQVATTVPSALITNPGVRQVIVRSSDGKLYSNTAMLNVTPPPLPNYNYVGIIGKPRFNDTAVLQDKSTKELLNVQRGDVLGGRFRINSISEREIVLVDTTLKIRHTIPFTVENSSNPQLRPPPRVSEEEPPQ